MASAEGHSWKESSPPQCSRLEIPHLVSCLYIIYTSTGFSRLVLLPLPAGPSITCNTQYPYVAAGQTCVMAHMNIAACHVEIPNRKFLISQHDIYICANNNKTTAPSGMSKTMAL